MKFLLIIDHYAQFYGRSAPFESINDIIDARLVLERERNRGGRERERPPPHHTLGRTVITWWRPLLEAKVNVFTEKDKKKKKKKTKTGSQEASILIFCLKCHKDFSFFALKMTQKQNNRPPAGSHQRPLLRDVKTLTPLQSEWPPNTLVSYLLTGIKPLMHVLGGHGDGKINKDGL